LFRKRNTPLQSDEHHSNAFTLGAQWKSECLQERLLR
jgi:hypothetical protein